MRNPVVAGSFYPDNADSLKKHLQGCFLSDFGPGSMPGQGKKQLKGIIVPHAGFVYSGPCAAYAYKAVAEAEKPALFIILGLSHAGLDSCLSLENWKTPLGTAMIDKEFGKLLVETGIPQDEYAHANEHSIEVQLIFLQFIFKEFKFVPVIVSDNYAQVADAILKSIKQSKKKAVIIASSDFTHYGADYGYTPFKEGIKNRIYALDKGAIEHIKKVDAAGFLDYVGKTGATICGRYPIAALLECIKPAKAELLKYYTSADISKGDYSTAVGYAAIVFWPKSSS